MFEESLNTASKPLHEQIYDRLKQDIAEDKYSIGAKLPGELALCQTYGVSRNTVRQALLALANEGLVVREQGKGTFVRKAPGAKTLTHYAPGISHKNQILFIQTRYEHNANLYNPFYHRVLQGLEDKLAATDYNLVFSTVSKSGNMFTYPNFKEVKAVILAGASSRDILSTVRSLKVPIVSVHEWFPDDDIYCVMVDNVYGGYIATSHLINNSYRNIGVLASTSKTFIDRLKGYRTALDQHGIEYRDNYISCPFSHEEDAIQQTHELFDRAPDIDALFTATDIIALGATAALSARGYSVPTDIGIVGYDDQEFSRFMNPPLTTIRQPAIDIGTKTAELVQNLLEGKRVTQKDYLIKPELIIRSSSAKRA